MHSSLLIGSYYLSASDIEIDANAYQFSTSEQGWYLYHPTTALSLIGRLLQLMQAQGVADAEVVLLKNRKIMIRGSGNFSITWDSTLRSIFGFSANLSGASSYIAPNISPLLWAPGKTETPGRAPLGVLGEPVYDTFKVVAPDGTTVSTRHFTQRVNDFSWLQVPAARFQTKDALGGEYVTFFDRVLDGSGKFHLWRNMDLSDASTDPVTWTTSIGPYSHRTGRGASSPGFKRSSGLQWSDIRFDVELDVLVVPEWEVP